MQTNYKTYKQMQINLVYLFVIMLLIICLFYFWAEGGAHNVPDEGW